MTFRNNGNNTLRKLIVLPSGHVSHSIVDFTSPWFHLDSKIDKLHRYGKDEPFSPIPIQGEVLHHATPEQQPTILTTTTQLKPNEQAATSRPISTRFSVPDDGRRMAAHRDGAGADSSA